MPSLGFEVWLPIGAIGLYLFDSVLLLYSNEVLFLRSGGRFLWSGAHGGDAARGDGVARGGDVARWRYVISSALLLGGRRLCFVNPLTPGIPQFRVQWSENDTRQQSECDGGLREFFTALRPLQYLVTGLWLLLLALPVELYLFGTGIELLVLMAGFYVLVLVALIYTYIRRATLGLSGRAFAALSFDSLACAPFAVNLVRKLAMRRSLVGNPIDFAAQAFDARTFAGLVTAVSERVEEEQQREDGRTPRWVELEAYRQQLLARLPSRAA